MTAVLRKVLSLNERISAGTDHCVDDIVVQEAVVSSQEVREHLARYGLESKEPFTLDGGKVLGIALESMPDGRLKMSRGRDLEDVKVSETLTKRELFSLCGRLVSHYPVAGWLRPCCSFLKRVGCGGAWDDPVDKTTRLLAVELLDRVRREDPVKGVWGVNPEGKVSVWTDASSLALGVALEVDGDIVEDATWLRKQTENLHIKVA
ncbi:MAG: hypothetical protein AAFO91_15250, partial [Bacteroidota bacterium]